MAAGSRSLGQRINTVICSLNEVEATLTKAALGAGLPIGLAEDVARAGVWLSVRGFDGLGAFLAGIRSCSSAAFPQALGDSFVLEDARVVFVGPSAIDLIVAGGDELEVKLLGADVPLLLLGLAGAGAATHGVPMQLLFSDGSSACISSGAVEIEGSTPGPGSDITLMRSAKTPVPPAAGVEPRAQDIKADDITWREINEFANRTYVPASDASRARGAGAGLIDTD